jgi:hypothetical protein
VGFWWVDRVLPGVVASSIWWTALGVSHSRLRRYIRKLTERQTEHLTEKMDEKRPGDC